MANNAPVSSYDTPDSTPWGVKVDKQIAAYGNAQAVEDGFYDNRDDMVGGTDTAWNRATGQPEQSGANWASYGDVAPVTNSDSGLGGPIDDDGPVWTPGTRFSGTLSQSDLAS